MILIMIIIIITIIIIIIIIIITICYIYKALLIYVKKKTQRTLQYSYGEKGYNMYSKNERL